MDPVQALAMGILQGITEFLPISSSAHLLLLPWAFGWTDPGLSFDVALHVGTLLALVAFFWRDWVQLFKGFWRTVSGRRSTNDQDAAMFWLVVFASVPGVVAGAVAESAAETLFRAPLLVAILMIAVGTVLLLAEQLSSHSRLLDHVNINDSALIGIAQAFAIIPGVSRSGVTISAGMFRGLTRESAARFSFLMSMPIVAGAALFNLRHIVSGGLPADQWLSFAIGMATAAVVGYLVIKLLLSYLQNHSLRPFAYYRFAVGAGIIVVLLAGLR
jgi:undecaprenyl-diphosphatase